MTVRPAPRLGPWLNTRCGNWMNACAIFGMGLSRSTSMLYITQAPGAALVCAAATKSALSCYADQVGVGQGELLAHTSCAPIHTHRTPAIYYRKRQGCLYNDIMPWGAQR